MLRPERNSSVAGRARAPPAEKRKVTLSCEQCRQRKTRCDKQYPCAACQRSHLECHVVRRCRLPRGPAKTVNSKDADLKDRVTRLEGLLADLQPNDESRAVQSGRLRQKASAVTVEDGQGMNNERADGSFWAALNDEVAGIRETLEDILDDDSDENYQTFLQSAVNHPPSRAFDMILFGASCCVINPPEAPPKSIVIALLETYIYRVDSVLKVGHVPSLRNFLISEEQGHLEHLNHTSQEALKFAICFTAVCTLTEVESRNIFMEKKDQTINQFRLATEVMLSRANLLTTSDITVLQAFVIYLAGRRTCHGCKKIWTLIASAVRIGQTLGLDNDEGRFRTSFEMEIRRRVWYSIGILDMQAAFDGGSHSVIASNGVLGHPPLNIDDSVLSSASSITPLVEQPGLTDMSYNSMMHEALICWRKLTHIPTDSEGQPVRIRQEWTNRSKIVKDWEQRIHEKFLRHCDIVQPFQRFMKFVGQDMIITMRLLERRPMHRLFSAGPPPTDDLEILELATDVVERSFLKFTDLSFAPWSWFAWVKWYVLAIMLAELCGHGTGALIDRAWKVAEEAFSTFADLVIDDVLWRSVGKLMRKARSARDASQGSSLPIPAPTSPPATSSSGNMDTGRTNKEASQVQGSDWDWYPDIRPHDQILRSSHISEPPTKADQARTQLLPEDVNNLGPETAVDDPEYMSWVNWELFVQDVGNLNDQDALETSYRGSNGTS